MMAMESYEERVQEEHVGLCCDKVRQHRNRNYLSTNINHN